MRLQAINSVVLTIILTVLLMTFTLASGKAAGIARKLFYVLQRKRRLFVVSK